MISFLLAALLTLAALLFGIANLHVVQVNTVFAESARASLTFLLLGAFGAGFMAATLMSMHRALKRRLEERAMPAEEDKRPDASPLPPPPLIQVVAEGRIKGRSPSRWR